MASKLLEVLKTAKETDLAEIDARIAELDGELQGLREARKLLDVRLHGKKPRAKPQRTAAEKPADKPAASKPQSQLAEQIHDVIAANGPMTADTIAAKLGISPQAVGVCCARSEWFIKLDSGRWSIATAGKPKA